jgi:cytochrome P450
MVDMDTITATKLRQVTDLPCPPGLPLLGNLLQLRPQRLHRVTEAWAERYGPLFQIRMARTPILVVSDTAMVQAILRDRPDGFKRPEATARVSAEVGGHPGLFLSEGAAWRRQRTMVMQAFAPTAIRAYFPLLSRVGQRLQNRWLAAARNGEPIALNADLKRYTVDIIAGLAFGAEVNTIEQGDDVIQQQIEVMMKGIARRSFSPLPYWRYVKLPADRKLEHCVREVRKSVRAFIASARERLEAAPGQAPQNMLEAMLIASDQEGSGITPNDVLGNVSTMLLAGEDTTSSALAWLIWLLSRNQEALRKATEEVRRAAPDVAQFTIEQMDALDYLDACVNEALRLKPPAPFIPLQAAKPATIGDVHVPKDGFIWCVLRHDSVSEQHLHNAKQFNPQRWLEPTPAKQLTMPFGSGPRLCPGRYLSLLEMKVAMASLLSVMDIASVEGEASEQLGFVMAPSPLRLRVRVRQGQEEDSTN